MQIVVGGFIFYKNVRVYGSVDCRRESVNGVNPIPLAESTALAVSRSYRTQTQLLTHTPIQVALGLTSGWKVS